MRGHAPALRALGVDAAILFSDLLLPLEPLGIPFDFAAGEGPVDREARCARAADIDALRRFEPREELGMVLEAIRLLRRELDGRCRSSASRARRSRSPPTRIEGGHSTSFAAHQER